MGHIVRRGSRIVLAVVGAVTGLVVLLPGILLGVPFWVAAAAVRTVRKQRSKRDRGVVEWREAVEYEPVIGWKTRPNLDVRLSGPDGPFRVTTDEMGGRGPVSLEAAKTVVFGDSFAFGHAADDDFFFPHLSRGEGIWSFGANGYNLVQELLWMERLAPRLRGKVVVWMVFYGNDLYDNLVPNHQRYRMPFVRQTACGDWEIVTSHVDPSPWPFHEVRSDQRRLAEVCSDTGLTRRAMSACRDLLGRGVAVCQEAGAGLVVLGVPEVWQLSEEGRVLLTARSPRPEAFDPQLPDRQLEMICSDLGVDFVPLSRILSAEDHLVGDCHWNPEGHRKVVDMLSTLEPTIPPPARTEATGKGGSRSRRAAI